MEKGLLIVISGPSGAGKGTICKDLICNNSNLTLSISATTRAPRRGEIDKTNYFFIDKEEFEGKIEQGDFLEYASVYGNYYGTPRSRVMEELDKGNDVILEIDIQGALKVKEQYSDGVFIFILPPTMEELRNRIEKRGTESKEAMLRRIESAYEELGSVFKYDYAVVNDVVSSAVKKIQGIIMAEKCKVSRQKNLLKDIEEV